MTFIFKPKLDNESYNSLINAIWLMQLHPSIYGLWSYNQAIKSDIFSSSQQSFPEPDITISHKRGGATCALREEGRMAEARGAGP